MSQLFNGAMVLLILANVPAVIAETVVALHARYGAAFCAFEVVSVAVFTTEYLARLWVAAEHPSFARHGAFGGRLRYACGPFMLIDLLAILPFYLALVFPVLDLRILRIFRLLRLLKLARYSPALATLWRVPLFAKLDALSVSRITNLLHARVVQPGTVILRRGDEPAAMYFIASGEVEIELPQARRRLGDGDFFGEIALLRHGRRSATVRALTRCRLLVLDADDFHELLATDGDLRQAVSTVAEERLLEFEDLGEPEAR